MKTPTAESQFVTPDRHRPSGSARPPPAGHHGQRSPRARHEPHRVEMMKSGPANVLTSMKRNGWSYVHIGARFVQSPNGNS